MKNKLKLFLFKYKVLDLLKSIYNTVNIVEFFDYKLSVLKNKKRSIFDYKELAKEFKIYTTSSYKANLYYGNNIAVKNKLGLKGKIDGCIEHGVYFGEYYSLEEVRYNKFSKIYTYSSYRKNVIEKVSEKKVIEIGPYILYAKDYCNLEKFKKIKDKYKRILLVFPSHSIEDVQAEYNFSNFLDEIKLRSADYDTIFICMYWKDILGNREEEYIKNGYKIVTAGHRSDPNFLSRLKTIIKLSDMTMSNNLGTHLGYSIALGKAHYIFSQDIHYTGKKSLEEFEKRGNKWERKYLQEKKEIIKYFNKFEEKISYEQQNIIKKYWGC